MSIACLLLAGRLWSVPEVPGVLIVMAVISAALAAWQGSKAYRLRDRFDLDLLREIHEREELRAIDPGTVSEDADTIVCPMCGTARRTRIPVCPNCGHS